MSKTIYLSESTFKTLKKIMYNEALDQTPSLLFGKRDDYTGDLATLNKIPNLHDDRYKDYELDNAWKAWIQTGYDKNSEEYTLYLFEFERFMHDFLHHISYTLDRVEKGSVYLHQIILDKKWPGSALNNKNWKVSTPTQVKEEFHCFYVTVLKLYQNPAIWNDFFFNENDEEIRSALIKYTNIITKIRETGQIAKYLQILPKEEYKALNIFMGKLKEIEIGANNKKIRVPDVSTNSNAKLDILYPRKMNYLDSLDDFGEDEY